MLETTAEPKAVPSVGPRVWTRIIIALALAGAAATWLAVNAVRQAGAGSYTAFVVVVPVLCALIASGLRPSPGVRDTEFDWIVAVVFAAGGLLSIRLMSQRLPALAGLWNWDHLAAVVWAASVGMVLFSVRHVLRLWRVWVFALCCAPAMPILLLSANAGGTEDGVVLVGAALATVAVYLSLSTFGFLHRLAAAAGNLTLAVGLDHLLGFGGVLLRTVLVAGVVPLIVVIGIRRAAHLRVAASMAAHPAKGATTFPLVGKRGLGALALVAAALLASSPPVDAVAVPVAANQDWMRDVGLQRTIEFPFITRFLGPGATLTRYLRAGTPGVAVDVMSSPNLARLNDYDDAVWYRSPTPANYRPIDLGGPVAARAAQSDPDSPATDIAQQWYALTWLWKTADDYQRVTVVVSQDLDTGTAPPVPQPITWTSTLFEPMLWLTRQQPTPSGVVSRRVSRAALSTAQEILRAGQPA